MVVLLDQWVTVVVVWPWSASRRSRGQRQAAPVLALRAAGTPINDCVGCVVPLGLVCCSARCRRAGTLAHAAAQPQGEAVDGAGSCRSFACWGRRPARATRVLRPERASLAALVGRAWRPAVVWFGGARTGIADGRARGGSATTKGVSRSSSPRSMSGAFFGLDRGERRRRWTAHAAGRGLSCRRTRRCAPGRPAGAGLVGFQLGRLAKQAAMQRLILRSHRVRSLRAHLGCLAALQVREIPASPPRVGVFSGSQDGPGCGCRCPRAPSMYWVNVATRGPRWSAGSGSSRPQCLCGRDFAEARPATQVGRQLGVPIARALYVLS